MREDNHTFDWLREANAELVAALRDIRGWGQQPSQRPNGDFDYKRTMNRMHGRAHVALRRAKARAGA